MAEGQEVIKFESINFVEKLRDKIKQSLIDLIPEEQWNEMLKKEIDSFFKDKTDTRTSYGAYGTTTPSDFKQSVRRVLDEEIQKKVKNMLGSPEWTSYWSGMEQITGEKLGEFVRDNGHVILSKWLEACISQVLSSIKFSSAQGY